MPTYQLFLHNKQTNKQNFKKKNSKNTKCLKEIIKEKKHESLKIRHHILLYDSMDKIEADFKSVELKKKKST